MSRIWTIARRELRGYFDYPTAYILIVAFLALGLFLAFRTIYAQQIATLRPFFELLPWLFAVFVPAITMRSLAEERRSRTLEWLMAQPLRERDVVLGKFLGDWLFLLVALGGTIPMALGLLVASSPDPGIMVAQYVGAALLAAQAAAIGLWASSVTRNQITAFMLAAAVSFTLVLIGLPVVTIGVPPLVSGVLTRLSVLPHFESVARGVIDLRDVLYFLTTGALFLALAGFAVSRERLSHGRGAYRRLRVGTAAVVASVVVLNLLGGYIRGRLDLTRGGVYTLSSGTRTILGNLHDLVQVKFFVSGELPPEVQLVVRDVRDLVGDMRRASNGKLRVVELNPDADTTAQREASSLGVQPTEFNVLRDNEFQVKRGWLGLAVTYANERRVIPIVDRTDDLELQLASDIASMTTTKKPTVAFLTGFGAKNPYELRALQQALGGRYETRTIDLQQNAAQLTPDSARVAVVAAPTTPLDSNAARQLNGFLDRGGAALVLVENMKLSQQTPMPEPVSSGLDSLLARRGITVKPGIVYDLRSHANVSLGRQGIFSLVRGYPLWPIALKAEDHPTTRDLANLGLGWAAALAVRDTVHVRPLWRTSDAAGTRPVELPIDPRFVAPAQTDTLRSQVVAVAVEPARAADAKRPAAPRGGRMIVVGDADFLDDQFAETNPQNVIFAANAVDWLAQDETLIGIRSKHREPPALVFGSSFAREALKWGNLAGVPLLFAAFGAVRITGRRRRARRHWEREGGGPRSPAAPVSEARGSVAPNDDGVSRQLAGAGEEVHR
jgi:ABC-type uncharacterized transport system involved in gliding motility auxiliary subunit/ABC-type transport system involved in multi-copper enzyme maturation permease subunit